jgi:tRNA U34 2-thiouridine synthase MnmA/TrmU
LVKAYFLNPVKAVSKGQSVVFYQNGKVLGGGIIAKNS